MNWKKKMIPFALLLLFVAALTACNRGVGCPNNFSIDHTENSVLE